MKQEKREKARLFNIVAGGDQIHEELNNDRHTHEILSNIPKYFKLRLFPERKPTGKIYFTFIEPNAPANIYASYTNKKPDSKHNTAAKMVGEIKNKKAPPFFELKAKQCGREEIFCHEWIYLTVMAEKDTRLGISVQTKKEAIVNIKEMKAKVKEKEKKDE